MGHVLTMCKELELVLPELPPPQQASVPDGLRTDLALDEIEIPAFLRRQSS